MKEKNEFFQFGNEVKGYEYRVLNERAVRATAGIMLVVAITGFARAYFLQEYMLLKIVVISFFIDFFLKTLITPNLSPYGFLGKLIVRKQKPDFVGAIQKRFAWSIGLLMSGTMLILFVFMGIRGTIPLIFCSICLTFMWFETSFGICVGCKIYHFLLDKGIMRRPEVMPTCPGGVCEVRR